MASKQSIAAVFARLQAAGLVSPETWRMGSQAERDAAMLASIEVWHEDLPDVSDDDLARLAAAYRRSGERFWPTPGQLLELARKVGAAAEDDGDAAWGRMLAALRLRHEHAPRMGDAADDVQALAADMPTRTAWLPGGDSVRIADPAAPWRLDHDPAVRAAMEAGVLALGGWRVVQYLAPDDAAARASFRSAYVAERARRRVASLAAVDRPAIGAANRPALTDGGGR